MMKLYMSGNSPYARRARITIREAGLTDQVEEVRIASFNELPLHHPGAKIPILVTESGQSLCESLIITRYLNDISGGDLLPQAPAELEKCLALESIASVLMDSLFTRSFENNQREENLRSTAVLEREKARSTRCYDALNQAVVDEGESITLASIAVIAALGYADWRAAGDDWRSARADLAAYYDRLMARPAFAETAPSF
jgi:glutathione S-transferase